MTTPTVPFYPITHDDGLDIVTALNGILSALDIPTRIIAEEFDSTVAYAIGDYCIYNGTLYRFTSAHSAGAWDVSDVTAVTVTDELGSGGGGTWGSITGTLSDQTDLANALAAKADLATEIMYFYQQTVNAASNAEMFRITNASITTDTVVLECTFAAPANITSNVSWTSYSGYIAFTGTCTAGTTANVTLGKKGN